MASKVLSGAMAAPHLRSQPRQALAQAARAALTAASAAAPALVPGAAWCGVRGPACSLGAAVGGLLALLGSGWDEGADEAGAALAGMDEEEAEGLAQLALPLADAAGPVAVVLTAQLGAGGGDGRVAQGAAGVGTGAVARGAADTGRVGVAGDGPHGVPAASAARLDLAPAAEAATGPGSAGGSGAGVAEGDTPGATLLSTADDGAAAATAAAPPPAGSGAVAGGQAGEPQPVQ